MGLFSSLGKVGGFLGGLTPLGAIGGLAAGAIGGKAGGVVDKVLPIGGAKQEFPNADTSSVGEPPQIAAMRSKLDAMQPEKFQYQKKDFSGPLAEFDHARNKLSEQYNQQGQQQEDAISRRFAALGNSNSGAAIKQSRLAQEANARARNQAAAQLGAQEAQARRGLEDQENQREFQVGLHNNQVANQFQQFKADQGSRLSQLDLAHRDMETRRRENAYQNDLNKYKAEKTGGLFGSGGFLGLGI